MATTNTCDALIRDLHPIGLGTFGISPAETPKVVRTAIELGYRRIDCAPVYFNEDAVGDGLKSAMDDKVVERSDLFVVSKLASPFHRKEHVKLALQKTLHDLNLDYLDLYLIHWPVAFHFVDIDPTTRGYPNEEIDESQDGKRIDTTVSIHETWQAMESLVEEGLVKYIGVSNFPVSLLHELMTTSRIPPAVNQCEGHPYLPQTKLLKYCQARGVHYQAYSPLGTPGYKEAQEPALLEDPVLMEIASKKGDNCTAAQIALAWAVQRGTSVVAKASSQSHLQANLESTHVLLTPQEMDQIAALGARNFRYFRPEDWWGEMAMAVFD
ncbi:hypothetical protein ACA910_012009 [Epithemia clementina (nom. ined.)]